MRFLKDIVDVKEEVVASEEDAETPVDDTESQIDDLLGDETENEESAIGSNPIGDLIKGFGYRGGPVVAQFDIKDDDKVKEYLSMQSSQGIVTC